MSENIAPAATIQNGANTLSKLQEDLKTQIGWFFTGAMATVLGGIIASFLITLVFFSYLKNPSNIPSLRLVQASLGMCIGFTIIILGTVLAWFGIVTNIRIRGEAKEASLVFACSSPGVMLMLCGAILIGIPLVKTFAFEERIKPPVESAKSQQEQSNGEVVRIFSYGTTISSGTQQYVKGLELPKPINDESSKEAKDQMALFWCQGKIESAQCHMGRLEEQEALLKPRLGIPDDQRAAANVAIIQAEKRFFEKCIHDQPVNKNYSAVAAWSSSCIRNWQSEADQLKKDGFIK
ncbi:unnamed protein product [uncultured bacterium]|nr:unnamed protein product [uncultured bacterium]